MPDPTLSRIRIVDLTPFTTLIDFEAAMNDVLVELEEEDLVMVDIEIRHQDVNNTMSTLAFLSFRHKDLLETEDEDE